MDMQIVHRHKLTPHVGQCQTDVVIEAIAAGSLHTDNIHAGLIRRMGMHDHDIRDLLDFGQKTLCGQEELAQYLFSYAPMVQSQWQQFFQRCTVEPHGPFNIADYGCGQGLGLANVLDLRNRQDRGLINGIYLVEPSADAMTRAHAIARTYLPNRPCSVHVADIQQLQPRQLPYNPHDHYLHLFSNVLDIVRFDPRALLENLLRTPGQHTFWAVSHERDFDGGSARMRGAAQRLTHLAKALPDVTLRHNVVASFDVTMRTTTSRAIAWQAQVEVG